MEHQYRIDAIVNALPVEDIDGFERHLKGLGDEPVETAKYLRAVERRLGFVAGKGGVMGDASAVRAPGAMGATDDSGDTSDAGDTGDCGDTTVESPEPVFYVPLRGTYNYRPWSPSVGNVGDSVALNAVVGTGDDGPSLDFMTAFDGSSGYVITAERVPSFLASHGGSGLIMHGMPGMADVVRRAAVVDLCDWLEPGLLLDVQILYQLVILAESGNVPKDSGLGRIIEDTNEDAGLADDATWPGRAGTPMDLGTIDGARVRRSLLDSAAVFFAAQNLLDRVAHIAAACNAPAFLCLSQAFQLMGAFALNQVSKNGLHVDIAAVERVYWDYEVKVQALLDTLRDKHGYWPGPGHEERYAKALGVGMDSFEATYRSYDKLNGLLREHIEPLRGHQLIHPAYHPLVSTGRTACSDPNVQGFPRDDSVRGLIVPSPGHLFFSADYRAIELCALAEICYQRYGQSKLRELINSGTHPHKWLASRITGKDISAITTEERQKAKAVAFGFPGGMGAVKFCKYAEDSYGVKFTTAEAEAVKAKWLEALPEMKLYMRSSSLVAGWTGNPLGWPDDIAAAAAGRVLSGNPTKASSGEPYSPEFVRWVWQQAGETEFPHRAGFLDAIREHTGSPQLNDAITREAVVWSTGRVKVDCDYCQARNHPFQGLAADGAKAALYRLIRQGFRVVNFIHDEFLIELPEDGDHLALAREVERIMVEAMQKLIPNVTISVEYALMRRWCKKAKAVFDDPANPTKLLPWEPGKEDEVAVP